MKYNIILISIIINDNGEILLAKRNREPEMGKWSLLGGVGALEKESDPNKAVVIEVKNDIGVAYINHNLFSIKYVNDEEPTLCLYFYGKIAKQPQIKSTKTIQELKWFSISEALEMTLAFEQKDKEILQLFNKRILQK